MIVSLISSAINMIVSTVSAIGPAISSFCAKVLPTIAPILKEGVEILKAVGRIAEALLVIFQIYTPDDKVEDMGDRSIQAGEKGITPDQFDDFDDYMEAIRNFELDPQRSAEISFEAKIIAGLAVGAKGLDEKINVADGTMANLWILAASNPDYFNTDRLKSIIDKASDMANVVAYFEGKLSPADAADTEKKLVDAEKSMSPEKDNKSIYSELDAASKSVQELSGQ